MLSFKTLTLTNGTVLINVPCDESILIDLGFSDVDARALCDKVKQEAAWSTIRVERNTLLTASDYTLFPDAPFSAEQRTEWADYRQQLRDITASFATPDEVVWPVKPESSEFLGQ
ncbi:tail fiber assembly protein [Shewanella putrefaciens]|uniref:tail fiber assembly protein n=1 Tax=Shewanella putrefaciens TaxID=24 RepID=UPI00285566B7|nr:tail fiber assembly protein [Shewanella putrefaciens]MDR6964008.1 hypothetical protein [Shewanella putrefaciens]